MTWLKWEGLSMRNEICSDRNQFLFYNFLTIVQWTSNFWKHLKSGHIYVRISTGPVIKYRLSNGNEKSSIYQRVTRLDRFIINKILCMTLFFIKRSSLLTIPDIEWTSRYWMSGYQIVLMMSSYKMVTKLDCFIHKRVIK